MYQKGNRIQSFHHSIATLRGKSKKTVFAYVKLNTVYVVAMMVTRELTPLLPLQK
jgi:hypothetical protein